MDLGPASRELAPLKLKKPKNFKLKSKTFLKVKTPLYFDEEIDEDEHLFNYHMFHHLLGMSNLKKSKQFYVYKISCSYATKS